MSHLYTHTHTNTNTHTHTQTDSNFVIFWKNCKIKYMSNTGTRNIIPKKFLFFNENIRSKRDSGQIERNRLKYLHYLNKMIENAR